MMNADAVVMEILSSVCGFLLVVVVACCIWKKSKRSVERKQKEKPHHHNPHQQHPDKCRHHPEKSDQQRGRSPSKDKKSGSSPNSKIDKNSPKRPGQQVANNPLPVEALSGKRYQRDPSPIKKCMEWVEQVQKETAVLYHSPNKHGNGFSPYPYGIPIDDLFKTIQSVEEQNKVNTSHSNGYNGHQVVNNSHRQHHQPKSRSAKGSTNSFRVVEGGTVQETHRPSVTGNELSSSQHSDLGYVSTPKSSKKRGHTRRKLQRQSSVNQNIGGSRDNLIIENELTSSSNGRDGRTSKGSLDNLKTENEFRNVSEQSSNGGSRLKSKGSLDNLKSETEFRNVSEQSSNGRTRRKAKGSLDNLKSETEFRNISEQSSNGRTRRKSRGSQDNLRTEAELSKNISEHSFKRDGHHPEEVQDTRTPKKDREERSGRNDLNAINTSVHSTRSESKMVADRSFAISPSNHVFHRGLESPAGVHHGSSDNNQDFSWSHIIPHISQSVLQTSQSHISKETQV